MLKVLLLPLLAVVGGAGGFFLRRWELATAFEPIGLAIAWAPATVLLIALSAALALAFALLCRGGRAELKDYGAAFSAPNSWPYLALTAVSAACLLVAALWGLRDELSGPSPSPLRLLLWALCLLSFNCVVRIALNNFRARHSKYSLVLLAPAYTSCLWLVSAYQQRAADPVVLDYVYELFAIICTLLGFYFAAGFSFGRSRVRSCAFFCLLSVYFGIVTLADSHDRSSRLLFLFSILYQLTTVIVLLRHAFAAQAAQESTEPTITQEVTPDE